MSGRAYKHAPRGRIKARPLQPQTHQGVKCTAKSSRTGKPCQKSPIKGATVCRMHGGAAPQVKRAAERRLDQLRPLAIRYYDYLLSQQDYPSAGLGAANAVMDRVDGKPAERVQLEVSGDAALLDALEAGRRRVAESQNR